MKQRPDVVTHMNYLRACLFLSILVCAGCLNVRTGQKTGTEFISGSRAVTYVTPEEYARMTPEERERINATVGVEISGSLWGKQPPRDLTFEELQKAKQGAKDSP